MKRRWKILLVAGAFSLVLASSLLVTMHVQPVNELEAYKAYLRNKGEKLSLSELVPPPVPSESNAVVAVEDAFRMYGSDMEKVPYAMREVAPGKALIGWREPDARDYDFTNSWDDFATNIEADAPAIRLLHQVLERPALDFQLDYSPGTQLLLPHLVPMKHSALKLTAAAMFDLHDGDTGAAATNILTLLAMVRNNTGEEPMISHLVRIAMTSLAVGPTWELLEATNVTDAQLAAVQDGWQRMNFLKDAKNSLATERAWSSAEFQVIRSSHEKVEDALSSGAGSSSGGGWPPDWKSVTEGPRNAVGEAMWRSSWSYSEELQMIQGNQIILDAVRAMETNRSQFYKADYDVMVSRLATVGLTNAGAAFFQALRIPDLGEEFGSPFFGRAIEKTLRVEISCRIVITAIALKRYELKQGRWPQALAELVPEFLASVPIDPYDGKPLKYRPNADGTFLLYSVGEDGVDDGGDVTPAKSSYSGWYWLRARDWVWPQPATPAEVQNFYEHPPK